MHNVTLEAQVEFADRYELSRRVGGGVITSVWEAYDHETRSRCALKILPDVWATDAEAKKSFDLEVEIARTLRGSACPELIDAGHFRGHAYFATRWLSGLSLATRLKQGPALHYDEVLALVEGAAAALGRMHELGIVHRNVKPANIWLTAGANPVTSTTVRLLDFGLAQWRRELKSGTGTVAPAQTVEPESREESPTSEGCSSGLLRFVGTPLFMSPEHARGDAEVDGTSDLWSLAAIVYLCVTGHHPFKGTDPASVLRSVMEGRSLPPSHVASVPSGFDAWWAKASTQAVGARYATAVEFSTALHEAFGAAAAQPPEQRDSGIVPSPRAAQKEPTQQVAAPGSQDVASASCSPVNASSPVSANASLPVSANVSSPATAADTSSPARASAPSPANAADTSSPASASSAPGDASAFSSAAPDEAEPLEIPEHGARSRSRWRALGVAALPVQHVVAWMRRPHPGLRNHVLERARSVHQWFVDRLGADRARLVLSVAGVVVVGLVVALVLAGMSSSRGSSSGTSSESGNLGGEASPAPLLEPGSAAQPAPKAESDLDSQPEPSQTASQTEPEPAKSESVSDDEPSSDAVSEKGNEKAKKSRRKRSAKPAPSAPNPLHFSRYDDFGF